MTDPIAEIIRRLARPLAPEPTGVVPELTRLDGIRAVLFDVYGTLFVSASGDIASSPSQSMAGAFADAAALCGLTDPPEPTQAVACVQRRIQESHAAAKARGTEYPEVRIETIWRDVFVELTGSAPQLDVLRRFAAVHENLVNPVWPMPGCRETLERLRGTGRRLGIVSNAQFYTLPLFPALLGATPREFGFDAGLVQLSCVAGHAKPGRAIYDGAADALASVGIERRETLFVGNDMLNDIAAASAAGFRTVLFAGDRRSLRLREGDTRVAGCVPDAVITELPQLLDVLE